MIDRCGANNPNYKGVMPRICSACGNEYKSYNKKRKYCSHQCYCNSYSHSQENLEKLKVMAKLPRKQKKKKPPLIVIRNCAICGGDVIKRQVKTCSKECASKLQSRSIKEAKKIGKPPNRRCLECGKEFYTRRANGKFCSYICFVANGGAIRAGNVAAGVRMKYGVKKDANHNEVAEKLSKAGFVVKDLSRVGGGVPDMIVWAHNAWHLVEVKNKKTSYGRKGLNKNQMAWAKGWTGGPVHIISTEDDVKKFIAGDLEPLRYKSDGIT